LVCLNDLIKDDNFDSIRDNEEFLDLIKNYKYVYTDFSAQYKKEKSFKKINQLIENMAEKIGFKIDDFKRRILFGTDFMINLMWCNSYHEYIKFFSDTKYISKNDKRLYCNINPTRFLFGENEEKEIYEVMFNKYFK